MNNQKLSKEQYQEMAKQASPNSPSWFTVPMAFLVGGLICVLGQLLLNFYSSMGLEPDLAGAATSSSLVVLSAIATGFGFYDKLAKHAGAGTLVPITGFANAVVSPAVEFKSEGLILGLGAKLFAIAGPVIVYGVAASVVYGVIYYFFG